MATPDERFLVTGALGCIGAWTVRQLVREGASVTTFDLGGDDRRLRLIMTPEDVDRVEFVTGDITDLEALERTLEASRITNVIHLAALQVPFCRADPPLGARVNVVGTVNLFEAVKRRGDRTVPLVYTSSIGMYTEGDADPASGRLAVDATAHPANHYGVYKLANEGTARVYWSDDGLPSIGLRPLTVYGVGRDQGLTSGPTKAMLAAALGRPYTIPFGGPTMYQYAEDVARTLVAASRSTLTGAHVFNLPGTVADGPAVLDAIEAVVPEAKGLIGFEETSLPFPSDIDSDGIDALGSLPVTPFVDGVRATVEIFRDLAAAGRLDPMAHGLEPVAVPPWRR